MATKRKAMTVRLPLDLYQSSSAVARRLRKSFSRLVEESLEATLKAEEDKALYDAFGQLGEDAEETDVEFALQAQREVVSRGGS